MSHHAFRLMPDSDLRSSLEAFVAEQQLDAAALVSCVGSLSVARLRLADAGVESEWTGPFEIVALSGTLSAAGSHCHIALAGSDGKVVGGHLCYGCRIHTTAEVVVVALSDYSFSREMDAETGYRELVIKKPRR